jgi:serine/threonine protein kinase/tetratricopeptide (TPR) repeat protein
VTPERFREIDRLLRLALERDEGQRDAFVAEACQGDAELRREVESLLHAAQSAEGFMDQPPMAVASDVLNLVPSTSGTTVSSVDGATLPAVDAPKEHLKPGSRLGRYVVGERLGTGGMGVVYEAHDPELNRKIAIKLMRPGVSGNISASEGRATLMREAQAMAQLSHPNVIAVHDVGTFGDQVFIAMEYVEGSALSEWLAEQKRPWREIVNMFVQTGRGLAAAHAAGVLHRDFKPDNVLVGKDGRPRVLDFGLTRALLGEPERRARPDAPGPSNLAPLGVALTEPARLMGTPAYMAPEQLMGQGADHLTDQYSFCVALHRGLYGEPPFKDQSIETLVCEMSQGMAPEVARSSQVPSRLRRAVLRGLRPQPADRYPSMDALLAELVLRATGTRRRLLAVAVLAMLGAIAAVGAIVLNKRTAAQTSVQSIAILPLKNLGVASDEATIDDLTNGLTTTVAQLTNATVISPDSAARYKTSPKSLQKIGRELSVDAVVSGYAKRSGSRIQISVQLTHVATGQHLWTKTLEDAPGQFSVLQADIAAGLLAEVESRRITPEQEARLARLRTVKPEVQEACLKGWLLVKRQNTPDLQQSIVYFQEAIREDPNYAPAYVGLANGYMQLGFTVLPRKEANQLATEALMKALSLDPKLGEAHAALSWIKAFDFDWQAVEEEAKRAIELSPNDAMAHVRYSDYLLCVQRLDEALVEVKRAQRLDPLNAYAQQHLAWWFWEAKEYHRSIEEWRKAIELEPNRSFLHGALSASYDSAGMYAEALAEAQRAYELSGNHPTYRGRIASMLVRLGKTDEAEKIIEEIKDRVKNTPATLDIAIAYSALKRKEETLQWLEYAYNARAPGLCMMNRHPEWAWLRSDLRFRDLVKRIGLPQ